MTLPAAPNHLELIAGPSQFVEEKITLANQFVALRDQRRRYGNVAQARGAHQRLFGIFGSAIRAIHAGIMATPSR
jgi:hypothetical protein